MEALKGGIELTGTLYTSAQGDAKDKLAMAEQIYDQEQGKFQSEINKELQAGSTSPEAVDSKIASAVKTNVTDKLGKGNGIATLGTDGKLTAAQLPTLKTINGNSIIGSGNITLDLTPYIKDEDIKNEEFISDISVTEGADYVDIEGSVKKIRAGIPSLESSVATISSATSTHAGVMSATDKAKLDLMRESVEGFTGKVNTAKTGYEIDLTLRNLDDDTTEDSPKVTIPTATTTAPGLMAHGDKAKLNSVATAATADSAIPIAELEAIFV
ncbi:MAG: hypothetical protein NC344_10285 [Bacteroidales bacterium]|nr:hypothetical protein [Bacteroidales bacterium]MCM1148192.1 hypothetical protein [Bacteroidales bacterium]MCM1207081.1 hypothetical protein [Bacillota bacterium]MCM1510825.1 hypothetical protein [Clostridium sp.]